MHAPARLTISSVETIPIRVPLARPFRGSHYQMTHRSTVVVRITTDDGIVGEAYAGDEDSSLLEIDRIVNDELAPKLLGEDAYAIERCWELARPATFDILRDRRIGLVACACIDAALWDAVGKALGQPLWRIWGGYRSRLPMMRSSKTSAKPRHNFSSNNRTPIPGSPKTAAPRMAAMRETWPASRLPASD